MWRSTFSPLRLAFPPLESLLWFLTFSKICSCQPSPEEIAEIASDHVLRLGFPLTKVLILDVSAVMRSGSVRLESSFTSLFMPTPSILSTSRQMTSPILIDVLPSPLHLVILVKLSRKGVIEILTQNIRHKCVLQIIFTGEREELVAGGTSVLWSRAKTPSFHCGRTYDNLVTAVKKRPSETCLGTKLHCRTTRVLTETLIAPVSSLYRLTLFLECNASEVRGLKLNTRSTNVTWIRGTLPAPTRLNVIL